MKKRLCVLRIFQRLDMGPGDCTVVLQCGCVSKNSCSECQEQKPVCMVKELVEISIFGNILD